MLGSPGLSYCQARNYGTQGEMGTVAWGAWKYAHIYVIPTVRIRVRVVGKKA